ncbi:hypothetical protein ACXX9E_29400 [Pseudomonas sp. GNP014]
MDDLMNVLEHRGQGAAVRYFANQRIDASRLDDDSLDQICAAMAGKRPPCRTDGTAMDTESYRNDAAATARIDRRGHSHGDHGGRRARPAACRCAMVLLIRPEIAAAFDARHPYDAGDQGRSRRHWNGRISSDISAAIVQCESAADDC